MSSGRIKQSAFAAFIFFAFSFVPKLAPAATGFQLVDPVELKMTNEPLAPGAAAIILYRQVDRFDDAHTPREDTYLRIKIFTEEGRKYGNVEIPFEKGFEDIVNLHARTIKPDGTIVPFDVQAFEKPVEKGRGLSYYVKTFSFPAVEPGCILEYYFTNDLKEGYIYQSHWIVSADMFTKHASFALRPYNGYGEYHLRWSWQQLPADAKPTKDQRGNMFMEAHNIPAFETEDYMPPENELKARVDFIYESEMLESDPDKYWQHIDKKWNGYLDSFVGKRKVMEEAVGQIVSPNDAPEVKLRKIYDRVQKLRNTSYEIGKTEQELKRDKEKAINNVEDVWKNGYGNDIQLTWLYLGLVRAAGFEAYGCWVANRREYFFDPKLMKQRELDSNVVLVKLNGKDLYLDPGSAYTPYGMLPWTETGVAGMKLDPDHGTWIRTTLPEASESQIRRDAKLKLSDAGDLEGTVTVTFTGLEAAYRRQRARHEDETARKKYIENGVKEEIPVAAEVELTSKPDWTSSEEPLVAVLDVKIPGWASNAGKREMLPVGFFSAPEKHIFEHSDRVHPIYYAYPNEKIDDVTVELPAGWKVESTPQDTKQDGKIIVYNLNVQNNNGTLHITRKLNVDILLLERKYYPSLRDFYQKVRTHDEQQILLQPGEVKAAN